MAMVRTLVVGLALTAMAPIAGADANSLFDGLGPRELGLGESMRADSRGALATTLNPAGLALDRALVFEGGYGHRPGDDANMVNASACDSTVPIPGCFYYRYFSADPVVGGTTLARRAHEFGWTASRPVGEKLILGTNTKYFDYNSTRAGEADAEGFTLDVGFIFLAAPTVKLGFVGYNLIETETAQYPRASAVGVSVRPTPQLGLFVDALWNLDLPEGQSTGRYGGGAEYFMVSGDKQSGYPLRVGTVHDRTLDATYLTGGLGYRTQKIGIDVGARKQVAGGDELMVLGSLRFFAPVGRSGSE
jgi:hypothetical protein